jgi:hypothetical protein
MRVVFTVKIEEVYRKADISHNGFYIGLWTIVEVALGFVVACSLSLPRLIQAKGRKVVNAVTSPFSTLRSVGSSPKGTVTSQTGYSVNNYNKRSLKDTMERSLGSQRAPDMSARQLGKQPVIHEETDVEQEHGMRTLRPIPEVAHDSSRAPTPSASSQYSSKRNSTEDRDTIPHIEPLNLAHPPPHSTNTFPATPGVDSQPRHSFHANEYTSATEPWNSDPWSASTTDLHYASSPVRQNSVPPRKPLAPSSAIDSRISRWPSKLDTHRSMGLASEPDSTSASEHYTTPHLPQDSFIPMPIPGQRPLSRWPSKLEHSRSDTPDQHASPQSEWQAERREHERQDTTIQQNRGDINVNGGGGEILLARSYSKQSRRLTEERMTIEEIEQEMNSLQQFRFEEVKMSLERARDGSRGNV